MSFVGKVFPVSGFHRLHAPFCCCSAGILHSALATVGGRMTHCRRFSMRCTIGTGTGPGILAVVHRDKLNTSYIDKNRVHTTVGTNFPTRGVMFTNINGTS